MYGMLLAEGGFVVSESFGASAPAGGQPSYGLEAAVTDLLAWLEPQYIGFIAAGNNGERGSMRCAALGGRVGGGTRQAKRALAKKCMVSAGRPSICGCGHQRLIACSQGGF